MNETETRMKKALAAIHFEAGMRILHRRIVMSIRKRQSKQRKVLEKTSSQKEREEGYGWHYRGRRIWCSCSSYGPILASHLNIINLSTNGCGVDNINRILPSITSLLSASSSCRAPPGKWTRA